ncbi:MAG TPA: biotin--[acetyl-CoA-carboxylase] ligase [Ignavibacteriaceae bacterium]|nr:biotin--[acetyl-CoA-carboxylase] ligase [Ignavibacteriaceae bacterium]
MFNFESFDTKVDTEVIGRNFIYSEEVESTNSFLLNKSNKFNSEGTILLAEKQSKGRGRKERVWYSAKGQNLTFSILLTSKKYFGKKFNLLNFATSLSVAFALENLFQLKTELKWPNDVLVNGKKICGILLESTSQGNKIERVVIGIGLNVNQALFQGNFNLEPTSVKLELGESVDREKLLAELLNTFEEILQKMESKPDEIMKDWKDRCNLIGEKISVTEEGNTKYGIFEDLDEEGFLLLKTKNKIEKIHFGDVSAAQ